METFLNTDHHHNLFLPWVNKNKFDAHFKKKQFAPSPDQTVFFILNICYFCISCPLDELLRDML